MLPFVRTPILSHTPPFTPSVPRAYTNNGSAGNYPGLGSRGLAGGSAASPWLAHSFPRGTNYPVWLFVAKKLRLLALSSPRAFCTTQEQKKTPQKAVAAS